MRCGMTRTMITKNNGEKRGKTRRKGRGGGVDRFWENRANLRGETWEEMGVERWVGWG